MEIVEHAGIQRSRLYHMENTKQNSLENKAISPKQSTDRGGRAPLLKSFKRLAKRQASSQASSLAERQASSVVCGPNRQAPSMAFRDGR